MKKYIIKNANGSEQAVMQAVHESREEAGRVLMRYLSYHNENCDVDDYLSPFDFKLEEVECKEVNEVITDFESARKSLNFKFNNFQIIGNFDKEKDIIRLIRDSNPNHLDALIALNELFTIAEAWNKEDEFVPNYSDWEQDKWFPWFKYDEDTARFVCADTIYAPTNLFAYFGSRLCFKTPERAEQFGKQFDDLYNKVFL